MIDEVPALCAIAAVAKGTIEIRDAQELRVKESDRLAAMASLLNAFGVPVVELPDGLKIEGGHPLQGAHVDSHHDHRVAMAGAILGLIADGETIVEACRMRRYQLSRIYGHPMCSWSRHTTRAVIGKE